MSHTEIKKGEWQTGLCDFMSGGHCLVGCFFPCILANQTAELIEDPDEKEPEKCGTVGCAWCLCSGFSVLFGCFQRRSIRRMAGIESNVCCDFIINGCCPCCALIQQQKELEIRRDVRLAAKQGYQAQPPMRRP
ncbi:PLAC8 family-domain-containing protein [Dichotomopilus funicola]|uniref:PLAC8 family-domain-containing protein n=1 Tax=Dichotomopilus funicola TaxID=1934379 RepID=A0AAN6ZI20_9PEZI|nr:PLAC8 family-domain-containing protein [Dichotomopilus funicola]